MARKERNNIDYFPLWKPSKKVLYALSWDMIDEKEAFRIFRNSSSGFIANKRVRSIILNKCNNMCNECASLINLEIDHIISVSRCFSDREFYKCNTYDNLQVLCRKCNSSKLP